MKNTISYTGTVQVNPDKIVTALYLYEIVEGGDIILSDYKMHQIAPGQDYSKESAEVQAICKTVHTKAVVDAYKAKVTNGTTETDS